MPFVALGGIRKGTEKRPSSPGGEKRGAGGGILVGGNAAAGKGLKKEKKKIERETDETLRALNAKRHENQGGRTTSGRKERNRRLQWGGGNYGKMGFADTNDGIKATKKN